MDSERHSFEWYDGAFLLLSMLLYIADIVLDIKVAYKHFLHGDMWYFGLTVLFVVGPALITAFFNWKFYNDDSDNPDNPRASTAEQTIRNILLAFSLGPILRYIKAFVYGVKFRNAEDELSRNNYYKWMTREAADAGYLAHLEGFTEAAPQLVLQIYILARPDNIHEGTFQLISCCASLASLSWSRASHQRTVRLSKANKQKIGLPSTFILVVWYLCDTVSRMLALGLFASLFPGFFGTACGVRYVVMVTWILSLDTDLFKTDKNYKFLQKLAQGVVFLFCYNNLVDRPTRRSYIFYYLYTLPENLIMILMWNFSVDHSVWYRVAAVLAVCLSSVLMILYMLVYYGVFHPNKTYLQGGLFQNCSFPSCGSCFGQETYPEFSGRGTSIEFEAPQCHVGVSSPESAVRTSPDEVDQDEEEKEELETYPSGKNNMCGSVISVVIHQNL